MSGQKHHQKAEDTDEVVVVKVGGFVHELDVGEAQEKSDNGQFVLIADGHKDGGKPTDKKK